MYSTVLVNPVSNLDSSIRGQVGAIATNIQDMNYNFQPQQIKKDIIDF